MPPDAAFRERHRNFLLGFRHAHGLAGIRPDARGINEPPRVEAVLGELQCRRLQAVDRKQGKPRTLVNVGLARQQFRAGRERHHEHARLLGNEMGGSDHVAALGHDEAGAEPLDLAAAHDHDLNDAFPNRIGVGLRPRRRRGERRQK